MIDQTIETHIARNCFAEGYARTKPSLSWALSAMRPGDLYMFGDNKKFGLYLKEKRVKASLNQGEVAEALGYTTPQFVSNWERGLSSPPPNKYLALVKLYKIDRKEFVKVLLSLEEDALCALLKTKDTKRKRA